MRVLSAYTPSCFFEQGRPSLTTCWLPFFVSYVRQVFLPTRGDHHLQHCSIRCHFCQLIYCHLSLTSSWGKPISYRLLIVIICQFSTLSIHSDHEVGPSLTELFYPMPYLSAWPQSSLFDQRRVFFVHYHLSNQMVQYLQSYPIGCSFL